MRSTFRLVGAMATAALAASLAATPAAALDSAPAPAHNPPVQGTAVTTREAQRRPHRLVA